MIRLQIFAGGQVERDESFAASEVTIGRTNANRLCLPANGVSARHCVIRRLGAGFELEDLESTNGTYVNRRRARGRVLVGPQDEIIVATFTIRIVEASQNIKAGHTLVSKDRASVEQAASTAGKSRQPKGFAPPLLPASEQAPELERSAAKQQWPQALPEISQPSAEASGSFQLQPVSSVDPESESAYREIDPLAKAWRMQGRPKELLIDQELLKKGQRWIATEGARPSPQQLHLDYLEESLKLSQGRRSRWLWVPLGLVAALGVVYGVSKFALDKDLGLELPKKVSEVIPRVSTSSDSVLSVDSLKPWLEKDPESVVLASVAKLKSLGSQEDAETWAWEKLLRQGLRRCGGVILAKLQASVSSMRMLPAVQGWAVGGNDGSISLFRGSQDTQARTFQAHQGAIRQIFVSEDGHWLFSWGQDHVLKRWDLRAADPTLAPLQLEGLGADPVAVALSNDGRFLGAAGDDGEIRVWPTSVQDPNGKSRVLGSSSEAVSALLWDQGRLYVGDRRGNIQWWAPDGQRSRAPIKLDQGVAEMKITADHRALIVVGQERGTFRIKRKASRWGKITSLGEMAASGILRLDRKGRFVVSVASEGEILMWDPQSPDPARLSVVIEGPGAGIEHIALDSREQRMVAADSNGALWSWDLAPKDGRIVPRRLGTASAEQRVTELRFDERLARWLVARDDGTVRAVDLESSGPSDLSFVGRGHRGSVRSVAANEAGDQLLSGADDQRVRLWSLGPGGRLNLLRELKGHRAPVSAVAFDKTGRYAYAAAQDGSILTWELARPSAAPRRVADHSAEIYDMKVTADGKWLISVGADAKVLAYGIEKGVLGQPKPLSGHKQAIFSLATDPQSRFSVSGGQDRGVVVWELSKGLSDAAGWRLDGHEKAVWAVAVSPDLKWIASAGEDQRIHVHRVEALAKRGQPAYVLSGHAGKIESLDFSPDGRWLASGGADQDIRLWDLSAKRPGDKALSLKGHAQGIRVLKFVAPGRLLSAGSDGALRLWNLHLQDTSSELLGHRSAVVDLVCARGGALALTASQDKSLRSWPIGRQALLDAACQRVGGEIAPEIVEALFKEVPKASPCDASS